MKNKVLSLWALILCALQAVCPFRAEASEPLTNRMSFGIVDLHLHAYDARMWLELFGNSTSSTLRQATNNVDSLAWTIRAMDICNIEKGLLQGDNELVDSWVAQFPNRFLRSYTPNVGSESFLDLDHEAEARKLAQKIDQGKVVAIGELTHPYIGQPLNWSVLWPYFRVAEEKGIPVLFHTGDTQHRSDGFGSGMSTNGNAALLADVAGKFPKLNIVACHAGIEHLEDLIKVMRSYPLVNADISHINWGDYSELLSTAVRRFREEGMLNRVHFGSDQCVWPDLISRSVESTRCVLQEKELEAVFRNNTLRLLRLNR